MHIYLIETIYIEKQPTKEAKRTTTTFDSIIKRHKYMDEEGEDAEAAVDIWWGVVVVADEIAASATTSFIFLKEFF